MVLKKLSVGSLLLVLALTAAGCAQAAGDVGETVELAVTFDQLVASLEAAGVPVDDTAGTVPQPFFEPDARVIRVDGEEIQVFEFESAAEAQSAAATISEDGSEIGTNMVTWIATPHFFQAGDLIVIYVGEQQSVVDALQAALGPQVAGG